jgi:hypothetical protein
VAAAQSAVVISDVVHLGVREDSDRERVAMASTVAKYVGPRWSGLGISLAGDLAAEMASARGCLASKRMQSGIKLCQQGARGEGKAGGRRRVVRGGRCSPESTAGAASTCGLQGRN